MGGNERACESPRRRLTAAEGLMLAMFSTQASRERQAESMQELSRTVESRSLGTLLDQNGLLVLGVSRLREASLASLAQRVEREFAPSIKLAQSMALVHEVLAANLLEQLESAGIAAVPLKGVILARRVFDDPAARESRDIDLLVCPDRLDETVEIVRTSYGYAPPRDAVDERGRPVLHFRLNHPNGLPSVEIHWRTHWFEERSGEIMVNRSAVVDGVRCLAPLDECASLLLYYARDGFIGLRNPAAAVAWWDRYAALLGDSGLSSFADEFPELRMPLVCAAAVSSALLGLPADQLRLPSPGSFRERRSISLATIRPLSSRAELEAQVYAVDLMLSPKKGLIQFIRRQKLINESIQGPRVDEGEGLVALSARILRRALRIALVSRRTRSLAVAITEGDSEVR